jgi:nicotinamide mononucleotide transporter
VALLEATAAILGLCCVALTVRQHIACWPTGLAMVSLYIVIFFRAKLYSDTLLQVVYVFLQIYGWHAWLKGGPNRTPLDVSRISNRAAVVALVVGVVATIGLGGAMSRYTDAAFPFIDAFATVASLIAQWLMGRKVLESWLVWIVVDVVSIGLYVAKRLYPTAALYFAFLLLATQGYMAWKRSQAVAVTA